MSCKASFVLFSAGEVLVMSWDALPPVPVRPLALHHALTHGGYFYVDQRILQEDGDALTDCSSNVPVPAGLRAIRDMLPPVTLEELDLAAAVLTACESGQAPYV
ncbi:hypothetical protein TraAM80_03074 [Trypanosoma rangeli]|uniref:Uncharacterized protein n=1 Tax=Trypanosoma rangeli TaxID=5698 RepID=A0A422NR56_TRYRA|nr:uncharacterized protein TraAM80_03074 [Trypanosoma rangeli]RNF07926.1 hypothetical protein TraAM80_03074 [Trypanosoma rangeli]|eukprot:RNF07926.1 hypothetical protein TraAM80_03074 [Trypanosoma rangeli]